MQQRQALFGGHRRYGQRRFPFLQLVIGMRVKRDDRAFHHRDFQRAIPILHRRVPAFGKFVPAVAVPISRSNRQPDLLARKPDIARRRQHGQKAFFLRHRPLLQPRPRQLHPPTATPTAATAHDEPLTIDSRPFAGWLYGHRRRKPPPRVGNGRLHPRPERRVSRTVQRHPRTRHPRPLGRDRLVCRFGKRGEESLRAGLAGFG